ncbi:hypothetical protein JHK82_052314 [Glycine max]|uniref:Uncharacterized protein n=2 Tax=Glycine subgen. Soja TaxID=1462606 RepID=K7MW84_SOYBN|nr:hypothetical protein JHK86_052145 [Glycine max]RZB46229.1 hypothetical protein D0Y65_050302 [Glycine soja]KAG4926516.1 hypothetical protein JHK85_053002 [Glycine max]KAG5082153.1 hypothetical protein JHK84_052191 [Glycine max]KAG5084917.1 hypothetical protein JHK82_052314 [Glycine max]
MFINDRDHTRKSLQVWRLIKVENSVTPLTQSTRKKQNPKHNITNFVGPTKSGTETKHIISMENLFSSTAMFAV